MSCRSAAFRSGSAGIASGGRPYFVGNLASLAYGFSL